MFSILLLGGLRGKHFKSNSKLHGGGLAKYSLCNSNGTQPGEDFSSTRNFCRNFLECLIHRKPTLNILSAVNGRSLAEGGENGGD